MLTELVDLARENSSARRRELLGRISDEFLNGSVDYTDRELVMFCDVLIRLLGQLDVGARAELAENLANSDRASEELHLCLARDEIRVAGPILMRSTRLSDDSLAELATSQSEAHLLAITQRDHLSTVVTDALVERGQPKVLVSMTENFGAEISREGFDRLTEMAGDSAELATALSFRSDMPPPIAARLMAILPAHARERLATLLRTNQSLTRAVMEEATHELEDERQLRRRERLETKEFIHDIREGRAGLDEILAALAELNRLMDVALVLAEFTSLRESITNQMLLKNNPSPLALVLRYLDVRATTVDAVARSWCRRLALPEAMRQKLMATWRSMDPAAAGRVLRFTKVRSELKAASPAS